MTYQHFYPFKKGFYAFCLYLITLLLYGTHYSLCNLKSHVNPKINIFIIKTINLTIITDKNLSCSSKILISGNYIL